MATKHERIVLAIMIAITMAVLYYFDIPIEEPGDVVGPAFTVTMPIWLALLLAVTVLVGCASVVGIILYQLIKKIKKR